MANRPMFGAGLMMPFDGIGTGVKAGMLESVPSDLKSPAAPMVWSAITGKLFESVPPVKPKRAVKELMQKPPRIKLRSLAPKGEATTNRAPHALEDAIAPTRTLT